METNARYLTIGCFTLAVIAALFGLVFWLNRTGGLGTKESYQIRFENSVAGLQPGAPVLFDGMRVGEVSALTLDPSDPKHVLATIAVVTGTPVRGDTKIGIESQGLMGTAAVSLEGGSPTVPPPSGQNGQPPLLIADPAAGRSLMDTARSALLRVDTILADNSDSLKTTIGNVKIFSDALARNSARIDGVMAGLERMTGGGPAKPPAPVYDLAVPKLPGPSGAPPPGQMVILDPSAVVALQTQRLLTRSPEGQLAPSGEMQWSDTLPKLIQAKLLQSFEDAGLAATLSAPSSFGKDDHQLQIDLRGFDVATGPDRAAEVSFSAKILSGDGRVLGTKVFQTKVPSPSADDSASVKALNAAFGSAANELAVWMAGVS